jgi:hypothetical protein
MTRTLSVAIGLGKNDFRNAFVHIKTMAYPCQEERNARAGDESDARETCEPKRKEEPEEQSEVSRGLCVE